MWKYNGKSISVGKAWVDDNGIQHPANWHIWSASDKAAAGLVEIIEDTPPDSRLYWWSMDHEGKITKTAKSLADVNVVDEKLSITATDLEVELISTTTVSSTENGSFTLPGRKLLDICRALPVTSDLTLQQDDSKISISSKRSKFSLSTLPEREFPLI